MTENRTPFANIMPVFFYYCSPLHDLVVFAILRTCVRRSVASFIFTSYTRFFLPSFSNMIPFLVTSLRLNDFEGTLRAEISILGMVILGFSLCIVRHCGQNEN